MQVQVKSPAPGVDVVENIARFFNGPTFLAEDNATTAIGGSIGDFVWADIDRDGVQDAGEPGIGGVTVRLYAADGVTLLDSAVTDAAGGYRFYGLDTGTRVVRYDMATVPDGYFGTTPVSHTAMLTAGQQYNTADFGLATLPAGTGAIGDFVWIDRNNDGVQDSGEPGIPNVTVTLERQINGVWIRIGTDTTDSAGLYAFGNLPSGSYRVTLDDLSQITSPYATGTFNLGDVMDPTYDRDGIGTPQCRAGHARHRLHCRHQCRLRLQLVRQHRRHRLVG